MEYINPEQPSPIKAVLNSYTQVMLSSLPLGGFTIALALWFCSPRHALVGVLSTIIAYTLARLHEQNITPVNRGFEGYNPLLSALAIYGLTDGGWLGVLYACIAAIITYYATSFTRSHFKILPILTSPFVVICWILTPFARMLCVPRYNDAFWDEPFDASLPADNFHGALRGFGEIFLQDNLYFSVVVMVILILTSWRQGLWVITTFILLISLSPIFGWNDFQSAGLLGFNPYLVAAALIAFPSPWAKTWQRITEGIITLILSIAFSYLCLKHFRSLNYPLFTAPFVVVTWLLILTRRYFARKIQTS